MKTAPAVRESRVRAKGEAVQAIEALDRHSTEAEVHATIGGLASRVVDGDRPFDVVVADVLGWAHGLP